MTDATASPTDLGALRDLAGTYSPEPLATTLDRIVTFNQRFIHHSDESTHDLVALWVVSAHSMPVWDWHGRLYITAPQPGVGKSTQAEVMAMLCPDSDQTGSLSGPGLFRNISANRPTMFIDEAEGTFSAYGGRDSEIVKSVVNAGYKQGAVVIRSEGNQAVRHSIYCAVVIVGVDNGLLPPTTRSRCIPIQMTPGGNVPERFRPRRHDTFAAEMQWQLANHAHDLALVDLDPDEFSGRQADLWESLYSVAVAAGPEWVERFHRAAKVHVWPENVAESAVVLAGIAEYFDTVGADRVGSTDLVGYLNAQDNLPHITSPKALARQWLHGYRTADGQHIKTTKSNGRQVYWRKDFAHAFTTWL